MKMKSRMVSKGFIQVQNVDYHDTTYPSPPSALHKIIAVAANELALPVFHLDVSRTFEYAPLRKEIYMRLPLESCKLLGRIVKRLKRQYGLMQAGRDWRLLLVKRLFETMGMEQCK